MRMDKRNTCQSWFGAGKGYCVRVCWCGVLRLHHRGARNGQLRQARRSHAQLMASGMGALHVQAGVSASHSTGEQVGFSYNYGESYGEQQSRSEVMSITREIE